MTTKHQGTTMNSFVTNNVVVNRKHDNGPPFVEIQNGYVIAKLDKYLIVPLEQVPDVDVFIKSLNRDAAYESSGDQ